MFQAPSSLRNRPPSPPIVYEWLARHWPALLAAPAGPLAFALSCVLLSGFALPIALAHMAGPFSPHLQMMLATAFTIASFLLAWRPLASLWMWHRAGATATHDLFLAQLDEEFSLLSMQVEWMLANDPGIAIDLARSLSRRSNPALRPADIIWLQNTISKSGPPALLRPPTASARAQLEQWGFSSRTQHHALAATVDRAPAASQSTARRL